MRVKHPGMRSRAGWMRVAGAGATGLMAAVLVPPFDWSGLVWVALVPLLIALWSVGGRRPGWQGFGLGLLAGVVSFSIQLSWLAVVSPLGAVVLPIYLGGFWGVFGALAATWGNPWRPRALVRRDAPEVVEAGDGRAARRARMMGLEAVEKTPAAGTGRSLRIAFSLGAVWAGLEWLRSWMFTGFGWNGLGVAFHETLVMAQAADLIGVAGLSLLVVFFQAVLVQSGRRILAGARDGRLRPRWDFGVAALVVAVVMSYGIIRMATVGRLESTRLKTLLVQINIPQDAARPLWSPLEVHMAYEEETLEALAALQDGDAERLQQAIGRADEGALTLRWPDWVVWPESALTGRLLRTDQGEWGTWRENIETIERVREAGPFTLMHGLTEVEAVADDEGLLPRDGGRIFNSFVAMSPEDELHVFRKIHLVIFGETVPLVNSVPLIRKIYEQQAGVSYSGSFSPGDSVEPLPVKGAGTTLGVIPSVCFEDTVPRLKRRFVRRGPQVIGNVTNDGWFDESAAAAQHFANGRFRAIELRRPMLRCANTGVTAAIDATGSTAHPDTGARQVLVDARGNHFTRGTMLAELDVPLDPPVTLYARIGDWGVILLGITGVGLLFPGRRRI